MPRFFFDVCAGDTLIVDEAGEAMHDADEAVAAARHLLPIIQRTVEPNADNLLDVTIRDETGRAVAMTAMSFVTRRFGQHDVRPMPCPIPGPAKPDGRQHEAAAETLQTLRATTRTLIAAAAAHRTETATLLRDIQDQVSAIRQLASRAIPSPWVEAELKQ